jgi:hypothetical protein
MKPYECSHSHAPTGPLQFLNIFPFSSVSKSLRHSGFSLISPCCRRYSSIGIFASQILTWSTRPFFAMLMLMFGMRYRATCRKVQRETGFLCSPDLVSVYRTESVFYLRCMTVEFLILTRNAVRRKQTKQTNSMVWSAWRIPTAVF